MNDNENIFPQGEENLNLNEPAVKDASEEESVPKFDMPQAVNIEPYEPEREEPKFVEPAYEEPQFTEPSPIVQEPVYEEPEFTEPVPIPYQPDYEQAEYTQPASAAFEPAYEEPEYAQPNAVDYEPTYEEERPSVDYGSAYAEPHSAQPLYTQPVYGENQYSAPVNTSEEAFNPYKSTPSAYIPPLDTPVQKNEYVSPYNAPVNGAVPGKKLSKGVITAIAVVGVCLVVAIAAIAISFFLKPSAGVDVTGNNGIYASDYLPSESSTIAPTQPVSNSGMAVSTTSSSSNVENSVWVAEKVRPSVVGVMVYQNGQLSGEGSGVLASVDATGKYTYVVTCAHVINESNVTYGVLLLDGRNYTAELVAMDERTDIGVLKIEAAGLPLAEFGDSSTLKVGETIYAIGNPGGSEYFGSFTDGIVSAIDRSITATYTMTCIQHNAAINPGNSGGALVNSAGQVIGINSSKIASTEFEGMGFAVPTAIAKPVVNALIEYGYVPNRPKLGIQYAPVSSYQLYSMIVSIKGLPQGSLVIAGISSDSSLAGTQAEVGDLIIGVNGQEMNDSSVLLDLIDTGAVGDTITLNLCRIEKGTYQTTTFDVTITLVEDKGATTTTQQETTTSPGGYSYGGAESFEEFFNEYFGW